MRYVGATHLESVEGKRDVSIPHVGLRKKGYAVIARVGISYASTAHRLGLGATSRGFACREGYKHRPQPGNARYLSDIDMETHAFSEHARQ
eukprot:3406836-Rhodomonas_salina.1